jgi:peptidyl-prolyl cis-trans isomerase A (cyclophilin A)
VKAILFFVLSGAALLAQPPAPAKKAATAGRAGTAPARSSGPLNPAAYHFRCPDVLKVKFVTTHGDFVVEVHRDWAPLGADRFYNLVRARYFNDVAFYRYVPNFIVQFGVSPSPAVYAAWDKVPIKDDPVKQHNTKGTLTYAMGGPNTRSTEFFINLKDNTGALDSQGFAPFGTVVEGMDIVEGLYSGYGEMADMGGRGPRQDLAHSQGKAYLDKNFPKLDSIKSTVVVFPEPTTPAAAPKKSAAPAGAPKSAAPAKSATPAKK